MQQWLIIQTEREYEEAKSRYEEIYDVDKTSPHFAEMKLLALLISECEKNISVFHLLIPSK
jgi:cytidylate kinase